MKWTQVNIPVRKEAEQEVLAILLNEYGIEMLEIVDRHVLEELDGHQYLWNFVDDELIASWPEHIIIRIYFSEEDMNNNLAEGLSSRLSTYLVTKIELESVDEADWANQWKSYYKPLRIGQNIIIKPSWETYEEKSSDLVIEMDPGMSFGTGSHETTSMCGALLEKYLQAGDSVFDIGTGSGILSIIAAKLGAEAVVGVDIDPVSVKVARNNVEHNDLNHRVNIVKGNIYHALKGKAQIIVSNIIAEVIVDMLEGLKDFLEPEGLIILSGIIHERKAMVEESLKRNGYELIEIVEKGEWLSMVARLR